MIWKYLETEGNKTPSHSNLRMKRGRERLEDLTIRQLFDGFWRLRRKVWRQQQLLQTYERELKFLRNWRLRKRRLDALKRRQQQNLTQKDSVLTKEAVGTSVTPVEEVQISATDLPTENNENDSYPVPRAKDIEEQNAPIPSQVEVEEDDDDDIVYVGTTHFTWPDVETDSRVKTIVENIRQIGFDNFCRMVKAVPAYFNLALGANHKSADRSESGSEIIEGRTGETNPREEEDVVCIESDANEIVENATEGTDRHSPVSSTEQVQPASNYLTMSENIQNCATPAVGTTNSEQIADNNKNKPLKEDNGPSKRSREHSPCHEEEQYAPTCKKARVLAESDEPCKDNLICEEISTRSEVLLPNPNENCLVDRVLKGAEENNEKIELTNETAPQTDVSDAVAVITNCNERTTTAPLASSSEPTSTLCGQPSLEVQPCRNYTNLSYMDLYSVNIWNVIVDNKSFRYEANAAIKINHKSMLNLCISKQNMQHFLQLNANEWVSVLKLVKLIGGFDYERRSNRGKKLKRSSLEVASSQYQISQLLSCLCRTIPRFSQVTLDFEKFGSEDRVRCCRKSMELVKPVQSLSEALQPSILEKLSRLRNKCLANESSICDY